ncbi:hypothetical protein BpHYR1_048817 [Brachionus plicatilis]|uniref:Transmembrane protein n=1 Tax=Brachionus plicatilis TaxID=10195 RepID=A0A3M7QXA5_BRAPC|nr:hypothetical protein BpHYR1_048817 [Brachionus plicatilis]
MSKTNYLVTFQFSVRSYCFVTEHSSFQILKLQCQLIGKYKVQLQGGFDFWYNFSDALYLASENLQQVIRCGLVVLSLTLLHSFFINLKENSQLKKIYKSARACFYIKQIK